MKKLFISQPMRGKSEEEIWKEREQAIREAEKTVGEPVEVIDSYFQYAPADAKPLWFLAKALELLSAADVAYFASGWQDARGCRIEHECAVEYGIDRIEDETNCPVLGGEATFGFGEAIKCMKRGLKVARKGWNGKNQYIELASNISYQTSEGCIVNCEHEAIGNQAIAFIGTSGVQMGWLASQADMLAEDWTIVNELYLDAYKKQCGKTSATKYRP